MLDESAQPRPYGSARYRYYWNRNHPGAQAFYKDIIRFAVQEIQTDLIHLDNYNMGPGYDAYSVQRFRAYLRENLHVARTAASGHQRLKDGFPAGKWCPR